MPLPRKRLFRNPAVLGGSFCLFFLLGGGFAALLPSISFPSPKETSAPTTDNLAQFAPSPSVEPSSSPDSPTGQVTPPETPEVPPSTTCQPQASAQGNSLTRLVSQTVSIAEEPAVGMTAFVGQFAPQVMAYLNASPLPEINPKARAAKVPVMMYHDIRPDKQVFFDRTPEEFERHLQLIKQKGLTPITLDQLVVHLRTGLPLPEKPILLTFDDGYEGHYQYVYPLLKKYNYPAVFAIYTDKINKRLGRPGMTWEQLREMAKDPLITISSHSVTHRVMANLKPEEVQQEVVESKRVLEAELGVPIRYFTYPEGKYNAEVVQAVQAAGYAAALTMNDADERLAGQSQSLFEIGRVGQSRLEEMVDVAWGGPALPSWGAGLAGFDFESPVEKVQTTIDGTPFIFISGGKPATIHANSRYQVPEIISRSGMGAIAAVDGTFFSLELLDSNELLGPVLSQSHGRFIPGKSGEIPFLVDRPLVLIGPRGVKFIPFNPKTQNTLEALQAEMSDVTDAFVAAGWLVENGQPQPLERFGKLYSVNEARHRAFWGINQQGQPVIGVSTEPIGSVDLGKALAKAGFRDAVMLDSGASTSLAYKGTSLVGYTPRPVPHAVALIPPTAGVNNSCALVSSRVRQDSGL
jgi:peptidoglycan/xylan/chitin deacetylase (PgdA/CDA1 family)